jgi:hypothetical protein
MANNEKTHAKNLEHVRIAISIVLSIGARFTPTNEMIFLAVLQDFEGDIDAAMQTINAALPAEENAIDARMAAFKLVSKRVTRILKAAKGQGLSPEFIGNLRTSANKIRGIRVTPKLADDPTTPDTDESAQSHSSSNRTYAGILEALDHLSEQLKSNPAYNPNEEEHKTATIDAWIAELNALNQAAIDAKAPVRAAREARREVMYNPTTGVIPRMQMLKEYVGSILEPNDSRYVQLRKLSFTLPRSLQ